MGLAATAGCGEDKVCLTNAHPSFDIAVYATPTDTSRICDATVRVTDNAGLASALEPSGDAASCKYIGAPHDSPGHWVAHVEHAGFSPKDYAFDAPMGECHVEYREVRIDLK